MAAVRLVTLLFMCTGFDDVIGRIYDLSHVHKPSSFVFEGYPLYKRTALVQAVVPELDQYVDNGYYVTSEHSGTHMDVPAHMFPGAKQLNEITVDMTIADGVTIDCSPETALNQSYSMPLQKLTDWESAHGRIPNRAAVIINFGWSDKFEDHLAYRGSNTTYDFPYLSDEAGLWLFDERNIQILAIDTFSPDTMNSDIGATFNIHRRLLENNRLIVENLKDPGQLPPRGFRFFAVPVKYENSTGTQVRAFAISYDDDFFGVGSGSLLYSSLTLVLLCSLATRL